MAFSSLTSGMVKSVINKSKRKIFMFVIVASSAKSDIESKECVCLTKVDKIETYFDKT